MPSESRETIPDPRDAQWVAEAYREHHSYVWRVLGRLGVVPAQIEDALHDVFIVVHRRRADFRGQSALRTWIYGIALRVARDYRRRQKREQARLNAMPQLDVGSPSTEGQADARRALARLDQILQGMEETRREVFVLFEIEGLSGKEIAVALDAPINTVFSRLRLARRDFERGMKLRRHITGARVAHGC